MTKQLDRAIQIAQSLSPSEQLELLRALSNIVQATHSQAASASTSEDETGFSAESFQTSWQQAVAGQTLLLSQLWEEESAASLDIKMQMAEE
ncbi:MAG: hypothetical protein ACFBSF_22185 [Leptolyngbyaceae cyanobacterium]